MMPKEPEIIETIPVLVVKKEENDYGDIVFYDENGVDYKLKKKRIDAYGGFIVEGRMVDISFAEYMNNKYVAKLAFSEAPPPNTEPATVEPKTLVQHAVSQGAVIDKPSGQEIGMTTKEIGDMIRSEKLSAIFGAETAKELVEWYKGRIKSTTNTK